MPLRWHHPLGLLFDLYSGSKEALISGENDNGNTQATRTNDLLPWRLTLHYSAWPADLLVRMDTEYLALKDAFMNSVKEVGAFLAYLMNDPC